MLARPPAVMARPRFWPDTLHRDAARRKEPLVFPREHVDDVKFSGIAIVRIEDARHGVSEGSAEERIVQEDDASVIRYSPVRRTGRHTLDH